jgi:hypothetical protein
MDTDSLNAAETELQVAVRDRDTSTLEALLHDEVRFTGPDGTVIDKETDLASHREGNLQIVGLDEVSRETQLFGDTGITRVVIDLAASAGDQEVSARLAYTRAWRFGDDGWQVIAAHGTAIPVR